MATRNDPAEHSTAKRWTSINAYLRPLRRKSAARRRLSARLEPEHDPLKMLFGTLPFVILFIAMAVVSFGFIALAWQGFDHSEREAQPAQAERGTAPPGWLDRAG